MRLRKPFKSCEKKVHNLRLIWKSREDGNPDESKALNANFNPPQNKKARMEKRGLENMKMIFFTKVNSTLLVGWREGCQRRIPGNWETHLLATQKRLGRRGTPAKCKRNQLVRFLSEYLTFCSCSSFKTLIGQNNPSLLLLCFAFCDWAQVLFNDGVFHDAAFATTLSTRNWNFFSKRVMIVLGLDLIRLFYS